MNRKPKTDYSIRVYLVFVLLAITFAGYTQADLCGNAPLLTSNTNCVAVSGSTAGATNTSIPGTVCEGTRKDLWYRFVATTEFPTVNVTATSGSTTQKRFAIFSGTCGSLTQLVCATAAGTNELVPTSALTIGATYYIRIIVAGTGDYNFNICITDEPAPPANDLCENAITLNVNSSCDKVWSTMAGATVSSPAVSIACAGNAGIDVWYKFQAISTSTVITVGDAGASFTNRRIQIYSGTCGALTSVTCATGNSATATTVAGQTYYVRILSSSSTRIFANAGFSICATTAAGNIPPRYGNSYINVSKKTAGGVVEKGDTLEVRMAVYYSGSTILYRPRYLDHVPTNTAMLTGTGDSLFVQTNEGVVQQSFSLAAGDDAGTYNPTPGANEYNVRINLGFGTYLGAASSLTSQADLTGTNNSRMQSTHLPKASGALLFVTAFRVVVTGDPGDTITMGRARLVYRTSSGGTDLVIENNNPYKILISTPQSLCANATGLNDAAEYGGTFGRGTALNRSHDLAAPIGGYTFVQASTSQAVGDGQYAIVKNMSPRNGTNPNANRQPTCGSPGDPNDNCNTRMFGGYWDVLGDHTGSNNSVGNMPPAAGEEAGYMLLVNSDNIPSVVYRQSLNNLCPNTYYEFSAWIKNVCSVCGVNPSGTQTYEPGVNPNLTFVLDGIDRYNTGEVAYADGWIKKGFVFRTGPSQTSLEFSIRTNSPGGGGNDWAMDDVAIATCLPDMNYTPTLNPVVCEGNPLVINNTIASYFGNYSHHQWQRSTDGGITWTDLGAARDSVPVYNPLTGAYEYETSFTIDPSNTTAADSGNLYRVLVATTADNLNNSACRVTDGVSFINLAVLDCTPVLNTRLTSFAASQIQGLATLRWTVNKEEGSIRYYIEKSTDGVNFQHIGTVEGRSNGNDINHYQFNDNTVISEKAWYRVVLVTEDNKRQYSSAILLRRTIEPVEFLKIVNPFRQYLQFEVAATSDQEAMIELLDMNGVRVRQMKKRLYTGVNSIRIENTESLPAGAYMLRLQYNDKMLRQKALKF